MKYKLYLDDIRYPDTDPEWRIARSYHDAIWYCQAYGLPCHIAFDHDLADVRYDTSKLDFIMDTVINGCPREYTGLDFAKWFCEWVMDNDIDLTEFTWEVHSANPVGAENIRNYMNSFIKDRYV